MQFYGMGEGEKIVVRGFIAKYLQEKEKERKELQDKVVDLVMNTPVSSNPLTQGEKEPPKPKTLEECIFEEATKEKQQKGDK